MSASLKNASHISRDAIIAANGTALAANRGRVAGYVQNLSPDKLYVKLGANASASNFSAVLIGGAATDDGAGGQLAFNKYPGVVTVWSAGTVRCVVNEVEA